MELAFDDFPFSNKYLLLLAFQIEEWSMEL